MDNQHRLQLANRIHLQLLRELGHSIDVKRLLTDVRYAVDVLLVCDALPEYGLHALSARFREVDPDDAVSRPVSWAQDHSGTGPSLPPATSNRSDLDIDLSGFDHPKQPLPQPSAWQSAARWLGGR